MSVIQVSGLVKNFGNFQALAGLNMSVEEGTVHGFLGPNGAGKSTTIRTLLGLLHPTAGKVRVLGKNPLQHPEILRRVGYVPGDVALWPALTGLETLNALESLRGWTVNLRRRAELIEAFDLDPSKKARDYSTGNRRKVLLVSALSVDADVLILTEPTAGLDPLMEQVFMEQVQIEQQRGATVLLSSHIMSEVERLCSHVTVIKRGVAVESGRIDSLKHLSAYTVTATFPYGIPPELAVLPNATVTPPVLTVTTTHDNVSALLLHIITRSGQNISSTPATLEELFLSHYEADT